MAYQDVAPLFAAFIPEEEFQGNRNQRRERVRERIPKPYVALNETRARRVFRLLRDGMSWEQIGHEIRLSPETLQELDRQFKACDAYFDLIEEAVIAGGG